MQIKLLQKDKSGQKVSFFLKDCSIPYANTLRRLIIDEVPTMAVEDVELKKNSSILYDEMLAHRLGLVVLKTDLKSYNNIKNCSCKNAGCAKCTLKLTLKAKGPCTVYASDLKSRDPAVKPVYPKTILVKLLKQQELELMATAVLGYGKDHSKWSPAHIYYKKKPSITLKPKGISCTQLVGVCPKNIFELKSGKVVINKDKVLDCHLCEACTDIYPEGVELEKSNTEFIFDVESFGQLSVKEILKQAVIAFNQHIESFNKEISKL